VGHEVFLTEKGGPPKNISSEGGGVQLFIIVEKNLTCNDYCYHREVAIIVVSPVCWFAVSSPSEIRH
jgi:hypothetical protein